MDTAEYVGRLLELQGQMALIQPCEEDGGATLLAQFNDMGLIHPETGADLSLGWHSFSVSDFRIRVRVRW